MILDDLQIISISVHSPGSLGLILEALGLGGLEEIQSSGTTSGFSIPSVSGQAVEK